ncbi:hypothetical protein [Pinirhizobacter soli]|uniref:hypothetical protein n=1 Tax=Pinirhizobacter soli TaxID=2786953 RepID=UPI00202A7712|nr:hypothetical protein [Pinirhizobacter soli]
MSGISGKDELRILQFIQPSPSQQESIRRIVQEDAEFLGNARFADGGDAYSQAVAIAVRHGFNGVIPENLLHGLPPIPVDDGASLSDEAGTALGARLARLLRSDTAASLHVPIALSIPPEIDTLKKKFGDHVYELKGRLLVRFSGPEVESELVRRSLVGLLGAYSVAWLTAGSEIKSQPIAAFVSIFDGEGWGMLGDYDSFSRSSM